MQGCQLKVSIERGKKLVFYYVYSCQNQLMFEKITIVCILDQGKIHIYYKATINSKINLKN